MRYQVPQFVDIEDKIFGPLTLKQFVYLLGGAGLSVMAYFLFPFFIAAPVIGIAIAFTGSLAFLKVNNKPFIEVLYAALQFLTSSKLYLWKKEPKPIKSSQKDTVVSRAPNNLSLSMPTVRGNNLTNMAFKLSVKDSQKPEDNLKPGMDRTNV